MTVSLVLIQKIISLFLIMILGIIIVRAGLLKPEDSKSLSVISLYLALPCAIVSAFCMEETSSVLRGLLLTVLASFALHLLMILLTKIASRIYPLSEAEQACVIYTNSSGMVLPLVLAVLGEKWAVYSTGFIAVQLLFVWSHGKMLLCHERRPDILKIIKNPNMLAVLLGFFLFILRIPVPMVIQDAMGYLEDLLAGSGMLVTGMLIGNVKLKEAGNRKGIWSASFLRMIVCPLVCLIFLKLSRLEYLAEDGREILFVTFMACVTPSALTVMQMAQVYGRDSQVCSVINVITTILGVVTMPFWLLLYQM